MRQVRNLRPEPCCHRLLEGHRSLKAERRGQYPLAVPLADVTLRATNADKGNWMEDAGSTPAVSANHLRVGKSGNPPPSDGGDRRIEACRADQI